MKPSSIAKSGIYLGAKLTKVQLAIQVEALAMSPSKYIQEAVLRKVKDWIKMNQPDT
jgi:hypothetical protein